MRVLVALVLILGGVAAAESPPPPGAPGAVLPDGERPLPELDLAPVIGPSRVDLGHDLTLSLPEGFLFLDGAQSRKLLDALGNVPGPHLLGMATREKAEWFIEIGYEEEGYVRDHDAEGMDADAILEAIRAGTEAANAIRAQGGFKPVRVDGWNEPPRCDRAAHHLAWAVRGRDAGGHVVNYNTRVLGRRGWVSLNLVAGPDQLPGARPDLERLLRATTFAAGARYEDFREETDRVAAYGLAALVAGGADAVRRLAGAGLAARSWKALVAFLPTWEGGTMIAAVAAVALWLLARRKGAPAVAAAPADTPPADAPPADTPPADTPPADTPPADAPPADTPPADAPPADAPPADGGVPPAGPPDRPA